MTDSTQVHVVSHTHWDREWYLPREQFRLMLVDLVDRVISILESDSAYRAFMLDGQAVVLEDYLEVKPENRERLKRLVESGNLLIGPWYVLPDEILISGESHIRNYLEGQRVCDLFGGSMKTGYLPDSFGHPSQMPQVLTGLGLSEMVFWRGLGPEVDTVEFSWKGLDGTQILGLNLPQSYGNGACMPSDNKEFQSRLRIKTQPLKLRSLTGQILIMNGVDHVGPDSRIPALLEQADSQMPDLAIRHSTLPDYITAVRQQLDNRTLSVAEGELRSGYRNYLLGGTLSTRIHLKQQNFSAEQLIERQVEPLSALAWAIGAQEYPAAQLRLLWRQHLRNLPHDSICGCSVDAVHEEMMTRYRLLAQAGGHLLDRSADALLTAIALPGTEESTPWTADDRIVLPDGVLLFNPLLTRRSEAVTCPLEYAKWPTRMVNYDTGVLEEYAPPAEAARVPVAAELTDSAGNRIVAPVDRIESDEVLETSLETQPRMYGVTRATISFVAEDIPPVGYKSYSLRWLYSENTAKATGNADARGSARGEKTLQNRFFRLSPDGRGGLRLEDKRTGKRYTGLGALVDGGDAGDEYNYSPPEVDRLVGVEAHSIEAHVESDGTDRSLVVGGSLLLPASLSEDRKRRSEELVPCHYKMTARLDPVSPRVDLTVSLTNHAKDHRLRIAFPTGVRGSFSRAEGIFSVDSRPIEVGELAGSEDYADWVEPPDGYHPQKSFVDVSDGATGIAIANKGLPEFQVSQQSEESTILVTLLRSVGWLSRPDLQTRKGNGGWTVPTEGAQCLGSYTFELSLIPHAGDWRVGRVAELAHRFITPPLVRPVCGARSARTLPTELSLVSCDSEDIVISALKRSEEQEQLVARLVNLTSETQTANLRFAVGSGDVYELGLNERITGSLPLGVDNRVDLRFRPWEIKTVAIAVGTKNGRPNTPSAKETS